MKSDHGKWFFFPRSDLMVRHSWYDLLNVQFYEAFGPFTRCKLNVDQWPCTKNECVDFFLLNIRTKRVVLKERKNKIKFDHSLVFIFCSPKYIPLENIITSFLCHGLLPFLLEHLFCLSHRKTCWTMSVNNVRLQICLLRSSNSMITLSFCPWCKLKWVPGWLLQHPITNFTGPWDDFMVHGVNKTSPIANMNFLHLAHDPRVLLSF